MRDRKILYALSSAQPQVSVTSNRRFWLFSSFLAIMIQLTGCSIFEPKEPNSEKAKNVILFIGDGMGVSTVTAARIFDGQSKGMEGEEHLLSFETFPNLALVKTYNTNQQVPDSAGTATAMVTGQKTRAGVINIGPEVLRGDCEASKAHELKSIGRFVKERGKALGVVTTTTITHATPATIYSVSPERNWESDQYMPAQAIADGCVDIAQQLLALDSDNGPDITLGGGRSMFFGEEDGGVRITGGQMRDWLARNPARSYIQKKSELLEIAGKDQVIGLFSPSHMTFVAERGEQTLEPTLREMTKAAITYLEDQGDGYFLMVEGGRIDHAHHQNRAGFAMLETQEFSRAIEVAIRETDPSNTLILVTADHSHVMTMAGYPTKGNDILGHVIGNDLRGVANDSPDLDLNGTPYTTLGYANGPGAVSVLPRPNPEAGVSATIQALIPTGYVFEGQGFANETHAGEDVALYGTGPGSEMVRGVMEQNKVFDVIISAFGWD